MRARATRVHLAIPVFVYGTTKSGAPFKEITETLTVSDNGALIELETPVIKDQKLLLANMKSGAEITCQVSSLRVAENGKTQVGVRFDEPSPRYWGIGFPPEDWDPSERKRPERKRR